MFEKVKTPKRRLGENRHALVCLHPPLRGHDIPRRLAAHRAGKGAKYTRGRGPLELVYTEQLPDKSAALRREIEIKRLRRAEKERLIKSQNVT